MAVDVVELLSELIAADTVGKGERELSERCQAILTEAGMQSSLVEFEPGREQLVATVGGDEPLTLTGHLDVVPVNRDDWNSDPFEATIDGDKLTGRGASDMKSGVAALVVAVAEHAARDHDCRGVQVVLTAGEETGCTGAFEIPADAVRRGGPLLVAEPTQNKLVPGHKGGLWMRLQAHGVAAHGSAPDLGDNAVVKLSRAATALHDYSDWPDSDSFGLVTANVGVLRGGVQTNVVPDYAELLLDMRHGPSVEPESLRATVRELAGDQVEVEDSVVLPPIDTPSDDPFVGLVQEALRERSQDDAIAPAARYFTDASALSFLLATDGGAVPTVILGPGEPDQCHVANEWCSVEKLREAVEIYRVILNRWCDESSDLAG
ncbi:M20/M25/M40 family metallo-hydrolase [Epidermidibacterium keratini]|uniref:M20/M25/M40 family metallo-hydrolase n=1 Tax=Epidermidibacterium keratini TaxID=1891644 RepID=A0A7L4YSK9_9ACTN|nr:M20/M25/M40 family metallo-hydrolase [Epidermidibacterium keratini]QHC02080.1 M20/M25/M40 family metallo-hydrolase [Epidermidibacterium keratini]